MTVEKLREIEARYQRATRLRDEIRLEREAAIRELCKSESTREVAKHVSVTPQRVQQIASGKRR